MQQPAAAAAAASGSPIYSTSRIQQSDKTAAESVPSSPIYATLQSLQQEPTVESQSSPIYATSRIKKPEQAETTQGPQESQGPAYVTSHFRLLAKPAAAAAAAAVAVADERESRIDSASRTVQHERAAAAAPEAVIYANLKIQQPTAPEMASETQRSQIYATSQGRLPNSATRPASNADVDQASSEHSPIYAASQVRQPDPAAAAAERTSETSHSPIYAASNVRQPSAEAGSHSPMYATSRTRQSSMKSSSEDKQSSPIYAVSRALQPQPPVLSEDNKKHLPSYASSNVPLQRESVHGPETAKSASSSPIHAVSRALQPQITLGIEADKQYSPIYAAPSTIITTPTAPTETTFDVTVPAADLGLRLSQLSPRRDSMTQTEQLLQLQQPAAPPRPPPPTFARPMHR